MIIIDTLMVGIKNIIFTSGISLFFGFYTLYNIFYYVKIMEGKTIVLSTSILDKYNDLLKKHEELNDKYIDLQHRYDNLQKKYNTLTTCPSNDSLAFTHSSSNSIPDLNIGVDLEEIYSSDSPKEIQYTSITLEQHTVLHERAKKYMLPSIKEEQVNEKQVKEEEEEEEKEEEKADSDSDSGLEKKLSIHDMKLDESTESMKELINILDESSAAKYEGIKIYKKVNPGPLDQSFQIVEPNRIIFTEKQVPIAPSSGLENVNWVKLGFGMFGIKM
jgi:hypothetical protein